MGIFGALRNKLLGRREELGDIRSHVLGESEYPERAPAMEEDESFGPREVPGLPELPEPPGRRFGEPRPGPYEESGFEESLPGREPIAMAGRETSESKDYEIMERLNIIEAQLSAIRSQTETINERLKNMEMRTGRRY
jgi:hypothetical protein